jgi:uncharacterized glyoxalase superfamily protein PhnB
MTEQRWAATTGAVRAAFDSGDLTAIAPLLAPDARWHGAAPGGCHSGADVLATITGMRAGAPRLSELHRMADRILLRFAVSGTEVHQMLVLDADGRITLLLDYSDPEVARRDLAPPKRGPAVTVGRLTPFVQVRDVAASVEFYRRLGFSPLAGHRPHGPLAFAALRAGDAELMLRLADEPVDAAGQGVLFYLYADDLDALRQQLQAHGAAPSEITDGSPGPRREMRLDDPDGYCLMIAEHS